jgi:hypothetical protein
VGAPIRINYGSLAEVGSPAELAAQTSEGRHLVLRFPALSAAEKAALISRLSAALPDHSIFESGGDAEYPWITVMPVVARSRVSERRGQILRAIEEYRRACAVLVEQYRSGTLPREWQADEHGGHCRFKSRRTGQIVEAPLREWVDPDRVDPYFFAMFVRSTTGLEPVAELLTHDFHDAARVLDVVEQNE